MAGEWSRRGAIPLTRRTVRFGRSGLQFLRDRFGHGMVRLLPEGAPRGRALLSRRLDGFLHPDAPQLVRHNQYGEAVAMAETLLQHGYAVDVIAHTRKTVPRGRPYDLLIASRINFEALAAGVGPGCIRIAYLDMMHWTANDHASIGRTLEVQRARGITPERTILAGPNRAIEAADYGIMFGNERAWASYAHAGKPIFAIPNPGIVDLPFPEDKDFAAARRRFLWLGSRGLAHKGLGRTLEAFARMPDMELTICGPLEQEPLFARAYAAELALPNVRVHGWIDVTDPDFAALARSTLGLVYPSCAEAEAGAVINAMHAGLVPVVSPETTVDVEPFGVTLPHAAPDAIARAVRALAAEPPARLAARARRAWETARARHTRARYKEALGSVLDRILAGHPGRTIGPGFVPLPPAGPSGPLDGASREAGDLAG